MNKRLITPVHPPQIEVRADQADFVANPVSNERGFGIIENDTFLLVEPTITFINFGDDGVEAKREYAVLENSLSGVKCLALPNEQVDEFRDLRGEHSAR